MKREHFDLILDHFEAPEGETVAITVSLLNGDVLSGHVISDSRMPEIIQLVTATGDEFIDIAHLVSVREHQRNDQ